MSESIRRVADHTKGFTIMVNEALQRPDLSARAKGLYAYLMTLPDDWTIRKPELYSHFTEGREAMETAFKELSAAGYIETVEIRAGGRFAEYRHTIHESSTAPQKTVNGLPVTGKPLTENPTLLSTDLPRTEEPSTNSRLPAKVKEVDPLYAPLKASFESKSTFTNYPKETANLKRLCKTIRTIDPEHPEDLAKKMLEQFDTMVKTEKSTYWKTAPFLPSTMVARFDQILAAMKQHEKVYDISWVDRARQKGL